MPVSRPSFMATITYRVDDNTRIVDQEMADRAGGLSTLFAYHKNMLDARLYSKQGVSRRVAPISLNVELNSHMQPDEASITVSNETLGIDYRKITGGVLQIYAGTVSHSDYARGMREMSFDRLVNPSSQLIQTSDKAMFTGYFQRVRQVGYGSKAQITIDAMDITRDLLDLKVPTSHLKNLPDGDLDLDQWIKQFIAENKMISSIVKDVVYDSKYKIPKAADESSVHPKKKTKKKKKRTIPRLFGTISYWEMIVDMCIAVGWIPNVEGVFITLRKARTFFGKESWEDSRFSRTLEGRLTHVRRLLTDGMIESFDGERNLALSAVPVIKVVASHYGRSVYAIYPKDYTPGSEESVYTSTGAQRERTIKVIPVGTVSKVEDLEEIARYIWENTARQEFSGSISTNYPYSYGGDNDDPDMMYIRPGDAVELTDKNRSSLAPGFSVNPYDNNSVDIASAGITDSIFRVSNVSHRFGNGNYTCTIGYHNWYSVLLEASKHKLSIFSNYERPSSDSIEGGVD